MQDTRTRPKELIIKSLHLKYQQNVVIILRKNRVLIGQERIVYLFRIDGIRRWTTEKALMLNGCNYFGKGTIRSAPFAIFTRQDLLQLAIDLDVPVPEIYGEIKRDETGALYTTGEQRTGCSMCGFESIGKRPHRFDRLRERNPKEWDFG